MSTHDPAPLAAPPAASTLVSPAARTQRAPRHFWADNELVDVYLPQLGVYAFAVYMLLARYARHDTGRCDPSVETIARRLGISAPTVKKAIKTLVQHGLLTVAQRTRTYGDKQINLTNSYTLLAVPKAEGATSSAPTTDAIVPPPCQDIGCAEPQVMTLPPWTSSVPQVGKVVAPIKTWATRQENPPPTPSEAGAAFSACEPPEPQPRTPLEQVEPQRPPVARNGTAELKREEATTCPPDDAAILPEAHAAGQDASVDALLLAMGVRSAKARQSLAHLDVALINAWKQVLDAPELREALIVRGIADPVAFAVDALRNGSPPPDLPTLRRWLQSTRAGAGPRPAGTSIRSVSAISPAEWGTLSIPERNAIIAAQAQRVNWRATQ